MAPMFNSRSGGGSFDDPLNVLGGVSDLQGTHSAGVMGNLMMLDKHIPLTLRLE